MAGPTRLVMYLRAPEGDPAPIHEAYQQIPWVTTPTPGLTGCTLLRDVDEPDRFMLVSDWESLEAYRTWQESPEHQEKPSALRPYQDRTRGRHYGVYGVAD